ncbi:phosphate signaling complex protein PhoU [Spiroplasma turonicum]|uniref:Phosphate transport system regulator PhoU n=1 Tax=Spiroplasma turonicum TaxID=216946 RepID=A0A0K1P6E3_9MOLU|nr:phosphate signaling complex protein PhoU [Spiroplasma turonicum]AKU79442.1 phosphate transport system regulator PhoU [Spiroplasma turonicum]ALX70464.1 phosphate transport system regulator PhoU [Spiroplasma turonicum]
MSYNKILDRDIETIKKDLLAIIESTKTQYANTFESLKTKNYEIAQEVINNDIKINDMQNNFTRMALWKIAKQQMVAGDLRLAVGGVLICREVERIADVAKNICYFSLKYKPETIEIQQISKMFDLVNKMLNIILNLVENYTEDQHQKVLQVEEKITDEFNLINKTLAEKILNSKSKDEAEKIITIVKQLKNLERASEQLINIEETVQFIRTGKFEELQEYINKKNEKK